jgi:transcriptional regulator with XRE-family HTH domain
MARPNPPINGEVLYRKRLDLGLTQLEVREQTKAVGYEVDDSNLSKYERGEICRPGPKTTRALGDVLDLTRDEMFAPCATCGQDWSETCMEHAALPDQDPAERQRAAERRERQPAA